MLAAMIDGLDEGGASGGAGAAGVSRASRERRRRQPQRLQPRLGPRRSWRCAGATSACCCRCRARASATRRSPRSPTTSRRSASRASGRRWRSPSPRPAPTRPRSGRPPSLDGDDYVLNGEKIYVTSGERADLVVVWASLDPKQGRAAIKSFVVERSNPGLKLDRLEHKLGIRASDTAAFILDDCRVPKENLLGSPEIDTKKSFAGAMRTFDNTRPLVAAMARRPRPGPASSGRRELLAEAGVEVDPDRPAGAPARRRRRAPRRWRPTTRPPAC